MLDKNAQQLQLLLSTFVGQNIDKSAIWFAFLPTKLDLSLIKTINNIIVTPQ